MKNETLTQGKAFKYHNNEFVFLGYEQDGALAILKRPLEQRFQFDSKNKNDWEHSDLRQYLNGIFLSKYFDKNNLVSMMVNTIADDGTYHGDGKCQDYLSMLSDDLYRKYRKYLPIYFQNLWSITPHSCNTNTISAERIIKMPYGTLTVDIPLDYNAVAPIALFNKDLFNFEVLKNESNQKKA